MAAAFTSRVQSRGHTLDEGRWGVSAIGAHIPPSEVGHSFKTILSSTAICRKYTQSILTVTPGCQRALGEHINRRNRWVRLKTSTDYIDAAAVRQADLLTKLLFKKVKVEPHALDLILHVRCISSVKDHWYVMLVGFFKSKSILEMGNSAPEPLYGVLVILLRRALITWVVSCCTIIIAIDHLMSD